MNKLTLPPKENNPNFHTNPEQKSEELIVFIKIENNVLARSKLTHKKKHKGKNQYWNKNSNLHSNLQRHNNWEIKKLKRRKKSVKPT